MVGAGDEMKELHIKYCFIVTIYVNDNSSGNLPSFIPPNFLSDFAIAPSSISVPDEDNHITPAISNLDLTFSFVRHSTEYNNPS